jgi:hypothetical protein
MDPKLEQARDLLEFTTHALDRLLILLSNGATPYEAKVVQQCQELLIHAQHALEASQPELAPPWPSQTNGFGDEWREYARRLISTRDLWAAGQYQDVLQVWRDFLAHKPDNFFVYLAEPMLQHLEKMVHEATAPPNSA